MREYIILIPLFLLCFFAAHIVKMFRLYLVLLEQKIPFDRFVMLYLKTTFVNLVIPFKLGEVYRILSITKEVQKLQIGILSVLVDRFFDTAALLILLIPIQLLITKNFTVVAGILLLAVLMLALGYKAFPSTYAYINKYLIQNKKSRRSLLALKGIEVMKEWYDYCKELIIGRSPLIIIFSCAGWILDICVLFVLGKCFHIVFDIEEFSRYIAAIFLSGKSDLLNWYSMIGALILLVGTILGYLLIGVRRFRERV